MIWYHLICQHWFVLFPVFTWAARDALKIVLGAELAVRTQELFWHWNLYRSYFGPVDPIRTSVRLHVGVVFAQARHRLTPCVWVIQHTSARYPPPAHGHSPSAATTPLRRHARHLDCYMVLSWWPDSQSAGVRTVQGGRERVCTREVRGNDQGGFDVVMGMRIE